MSQDQCMSFYAEFVRRRAKAGTDILHQLQPEHCHRLHMTLGVVGEILELQAALTCDEVLEELGDIEYFLQGLMASYGVARTPELYGRIVPFHDVPVFLGLVFEPVLTYVKREIIYHKEQPLEPLHAALIKFDRALLDAEETCSVERADVLAANMEKLTKRYPHGYTDAAAHARNDKACTNLTASSDNHDPPQAI